MPDDTWAASAYSMLGPDSNMNPTFPCFSSIREHVFICLSVAAIFIVPIRAHGDTVYVANVSTGTIGEYNATTGAPVNTAFITGLSGPFGLALSGNDLYVANQFNGTIGEYNATTGAVINSALVTGLSTPLDVKVFAGNLYVTNFGGNTIGEYNATTGAVINSTFITGLDQPAEMALLGSSLYVANIRSDVGYNATVGEYDAVTGAAINPALITQGSGAAYGLAVSGTQLFLAQSGTVNEYNSVTGALIQSSFVPAESNYLAVNGGNLFVADGSAAYNHVSEWNATTGALVNNSFITGLNGSAGIVFRNTSASVPDSSSSSTLMLMSLIIMFGLRAIGRKPA